jgi:plasmid maintenance system antidote protein VapI
VKLREKVERRLAKVLRGTVAATDVMRLLDEEHVFEPRSDASVLDSAKQVACDAWLEAGGCANCWGTGAVVAEMTMKAAVNLHVYGCSCADAAREIGLSPNIPEAYQRAVVVAFARLVRRDESPLSQEDLREAVEESDREDALGYHDLVTYPPNDDPAAHDSDEATRRALETFVDDISPLQVERIFGTPAHPPGILSEAQTALFLGVVNRRRPVSDLHQLVDGELAVTQDQALRLQEVLSTERAMPLLQAMVDLTRRRALIRRTP